MEERRKSRRMELTSRLLIKNLSENSQGEVTIEIMDVSKTGVGFICEAQLDVGAVYEAYMTLWMKETVHSFLEIVRSGKTADNRNSYGAIFIGMSEMDAKRIETFDTMSKMEK